MIGPLLVAAAVLLGGGPPTIGITVVDDVPDAAPGDGRCATADGRCTLRAAVMEASAGTEGDILLLPGTYTLSAGPLLVAGNVVVKGKGATIEVAKGPRGFDVAPGGSLTLEDVTLTGGVGLDEGGSAIRANEASVTLRDAVVKGNAADGDGGAVVVSSGSLVVERTEFSENFGQSGGAVLAVDSSVRIVGSTFTANGAAQDGGAVLLSHPRDLLIEDTAFKGNTARGRGGALFVERASGAVKGATFEDNTSMNEGGGAFVGSTSNGLVSGKLSFEGGRFAGNVAAVGGGLAVERGRVEVVGSDFARNRGDGGRGGAVASGGELVVRDADFSENSAETSGGAVAAAASLVLQGSTFTGNRAGGSGGALAWTGRGAPDVKANSFKGNAAEDGSPNIWSTGEAVDLDAATAGFRSGHRSTRWTEPLAAVGAVALLAVGVIALRRRRRTAS